MVMGKYMRYMKILDKIAIEDGIENSIYNYCTEEGSRKYTWLITPYRLLANVHNNIIIREKEIKIPKERDFDLQYSQLKKVFKLCKDVNLVIPIGLVKVIVYNNIVTFMIRDKVIMTTRTIKSNNITFYIPYNYLNKISVLNLSNKAGRVDICIIDDICMFYSGRIVYGIKTARENY